MTIICVALALNRLVEMVPSMNRLRFLFEGILPYYSLGLRWDQTFIFLILGRNVYMWMALCVTIMLVRPFVSHPILYNTKISSFLTAPVITDDLCGVSTHKV